MALITNLSPPAGTPIAADGVISFDVIDPLIADLRIFVWTVFADTGQVDLVRDGDNFQANYAASTVSGTPGGRTFSVRRVGGWPSQPQIRVSDCACPPEIAGSSDTTAANVGGFTGVYQTQVADELRFKSLRSSDGSVSIVGNASDIDITTAAASAATIASPNVDKSVAVIGVSTSFARQDHKHDIDTAAAVGLSNVTTNTEGASTSTARADHTHAVTGFPGLTSSAPVNVTKGASNVGVSSEAARQDHKHDANTATAVGLSNVTTNTEGASSAFARADHTHAVTGFSAGDMATDPLWDIAGDLAYGTGADTGAKLAIGTALQVLQVNAGATAPEWVTSASGTTIANDVLWDVAGDTCYGTGADTGAKLAIGTNGQVLTVNAGATAPEWTTLASSTTIATDVLWDTAGDTCYGTGADTGAKLAIGTANQVLTVNAGATAPEWQTPSSGTTMATDTLWDGAGEIAYGTGNDTATKVAIGLTGQVLAVNSGATAPEWVDNNTGGGSVTAKGSLGWGTTHTSIRIFVNRATTGTGLTWSSTAALGSYVTVTNDALVFMSMTYTWDTDGDNPEAIAVNTAAALSNTFKNAGARGIQSFTGAAPGETVATSWIVKVSAGDLIWFSVLDKANGGGSSTVEYQCAASIILEY